MEKDQLDLMNEEMQVAINPQTALNTHEKINTVYSGEVGKMEAG
ncbi:MAG: PaaI family thioesterase, partial [Sulfuricurvum sp.]|nr:PaaI family thioesterase [Sulfuricurvum sp.]